MCFWPSLQHNSEAPVGFCFMIWGRLSPWLRDKKAPPAAERGFQPKPFREWLVPWVLGACTVTHTNTKRACKLSRETMGIFLCLLTGDGSHYLSVSCCILHGTMGAHCCFKMHSFLSTYGRICFSLFVNLLPTFKAFKGLILDLFFLFFHLRLQWSSLAQSIIQNNLLKTHI